MTTSEPPRAGEADQRGAVGSDVARRAAAGRAAAASPPRRQGVDAALEITSDDPAPHALPQRPPLHDKASPPVIVKLPPPLPVRLAQTVWIVSLVVGACAVVYLFIIRQAQLPDIAAAIKTVDDTRAEATYETAADIVFWTVFAALIVVLLLQLTFVVSFSNRRPHMRWWLLGTLLLQGVVLLIARELVAVGDRGQPLTLLLLAQLGLGMLGLLLSTLPVALRWTARQYDVRNEVAA